jgi:hypothetical protein
VSGLNMGIATVLGASGPAERSPAAGSRGTVGMSESTGNCPTTTVRWQPGPCLSRRDRSQRPVPAVAERPANETEIETDGRRSTRGATPDLEARMGADLDTLPVAHGACGESCGERFT